MGPLFEGIPVFYTYNCPSHQGKNWEFYFILEHKVKDTLIFFLCCFSFCFCSRNSQFGVQEMLFDWLTFLYTNTLKTHRAQRHYKTMQ